MYVVAKPFKTAIRRFVSGAHVTPIEAEEEGTLSFAQLKERGFIKGRRPDYDAMTKQDLNALAAERGLDVSQAKTKHDVVALIEHAEKAEEAIQTGNYEIMVKTDLEQLAAQRGLDISQARTKADLIALLQENDAGQPVSVPQS